MVRTLTIDLLRLIWSVLRQVVLPGSKTAGNLISSLFLLFTGLAESLMTFRQSFLAIPISLPIHKGLLKRKALIATWSSAKKYIRLATIVAAWGLFILSAFEGAGISSEPQQTIACTQSTPRKVRITLTVDPVSPVPTTYLPSIVYSDHSFAAPKRWLLLCTLRV